jgi:hypothetical protein
MWFSVFLPFLHSPLFPCEIWASFAGGGDDDRVLGCGGHWMAYKVTLDDNREVA